MQLCPVSLPSLKTWELLNGKGTPSILMVIAIYSPNKTHGIKFVDNYTNIYIREALARVKGVGDIFTRADPFGMRIWLNPDKLAELHLTPAGHNPGSAGTKCAGCCRYCRGSPSTELPGFRIYLFCRREACQRG